MIDLDELLRSDAERWNANRPAPLDLDQQVARALGTGPRRGVRFVLPTFAAAAVIAVVVALAAAGVFRTDASRVATAPSIDRSATTSPTPSATNSPQPISTITGVVWTDPTTGATVVYSTTTMRTFDGCSAQLNQLRVADNTISRGSDIGPAGTCTGLGRVGDPTIEGAQQQAELRLEHFYAITRGPATWDRVGNMLTLRVVGEGDLNLVNSGGSSQTTETSWTLSFYVDTDGRTEHYSFSAQLQIMPDGSVHVDDGCTTIRGNANAMSQIMRFTPPSGACPGNRAAHSLAAVVDTMASEYIRYSIRGTTLELRDTHGRLLEYRRNNYVHG